MKSARTDGQFSSGGGEGDKNWGPYSQGGGRSALPRANFFHSFGVLDARPQELVAARKDLEADSPMARAEAPRSSARQSDRAG